MTAYKERFPSGTVVRIVERAELETFRAQWDLHDRLSSEQMEFAGREAVVRDVGFYHGGEPLYVLSGVPGVWHEPCLSVPQAHAV